MTLRRIQETEDQMISTEILLSLKEDETLTITKSSPGSLKSHEEV